MPGGGGDAEDSRPRPQARGRRQHQTPSLPFDVMVDIAACSDPATLVRFAATCREARRRVAADPSFRRRLRLRHTDRFVLPLLRGHLAQKDSYHGRGAYKETLHLVLTTTSDAAATSRQLTIADGFPPPPEPPWRQWHQRVASRDGLLLICTTEQYYPERRQELRVCAPEAGRSHILPSEPTFPQVELEPYWHYQQEQWEPYVLLVGDAAGAGGTGIDRPFQVLKTNLVFTSHRRYLQIQTFSSETGTWGPYNEIRVPHVRGGRLKHGGKPLVADGIVHWLCLTDKASYVLKMHIKSARTTASELPASFHSSKWKMDSLLATTSPGGSLVVLVVDGEGISYWEHAKFTGKWKPHPHQVIKKEAIPRFNNVGELVEKKPVGHIRVQLEWFAERSGVVLISMTRYGFFWLDVRFMQIVRYLVPSISYNIHCPYEIDLSSWAPTFSNALV